MLNIVESAFRPDDFTIERHGLTTDVYLRKNIEYIEVKDEEQPHSYYKYDEAYAQYNSVEAPTAEQLEKEFDYWFEITAAAGRQISVVQLRADIDYIAAVADIPL